MKLVENDDYSFFDTCILNSSLICKLIIVYFPQKVFPVCTKSALEKYCRVLGMQYDKDENMIITMQELLKRKQNLGEIAEWSDYIYMRFADWLSESKKTIKDCNISNSKVEERLVEAERIEKNINDIGVVGSDREAIVKQRVNQSIFRDFLLDRYNKCCLCGVNDNRLLIASHIKPWNVASPEERVDIDNGFIFCPNHDKAFDKGLISFDDNGHIIISEQIDSTNKVFMNIREDMTIQVTEGNKKYLKYHRANILDNFSEDV